jgi:adenosylmethionine-8-amino-7-oxononanoate aminotransferase
MTHLLHRQIGQVYPVAAGGDRAYLIDSADRRYIDACGGAAVSSLGHQHPEVLAAMHAQLDRLAYAHTSFFTSEAAEALGEELLAHAPANMTHVYLVSGGSEAMEAALKMARALHRAPPELSRQHARRAFRRRQRLAASAVRTAADRESFHRSVL